jgi:hypothetical protein
MIDASARDVGTVNVRASLASQLAALTFNTLSILHRAAVGSRTESVWRTQGELPICAPFDILNPKYVRRFHPLLSPSSPDSTCPPRTRARTATTPLQWLTTAEP